MTDFEKTTATRNRMVIAAVLAVVMAASAAMLLAPSSDAETIDDGEATLYGYKVVFTLKEPEQIESVTWNFGDGTPEETVEISETNTNGLVRHTYENIGDYTVTATMHNSFDGGSTTVMTKVYHIMGYPVITFETGEGSDVPSYTGTKSAYNASAGKPADPTMEGYNFGGWFKDADCEQPFDWDSSVIAHTTLYAKWDIKTYTVVYDLAQGTGDIESPVTVEHGKTLQIPATPERDGFIFMGWQLNGADWDFTKPVTGDMTLVAVWEEVSEDKTYYKVVFDANGGEAGYDERNVLEGNNVVLPDATRDGYTFDGWYSGENRVGVAGDSVQVNSNMTLVAHWTEIVTEEPDDGDGDMLYLIGAIVCAVLAIVCLALATRTNYYSVIGTAIFAIAAAVLALLYFEVI